VKAALISLALVACAASTREKTIATTLAAADASAKTFESYDAMHQQDIVTAAGDRTVALANLDAYRKKRDVAALGLSALYRAIAVAEQLNDDQSFTSMLQAALIVGQELADLGVKP
jgi:hypothetical protein